MTNRRLDSITQRCGCHAPPINHSCWHSYQDSQHYDDNTSIANTICAQVADRELLRSGRLQPLRRRLSASTESEIDSLLQVPTHQPPRITVNASHIYVQCGCTSAYDSQSTSVPRPQSHICVGDSWSPHRAQVCTRWKLVVVVGWNCWEWSVTKHYKALQSSF